MINDFLIKGVLIIYNLFKVDFYILLDGFYENFIVMCDILNIFYVDFMSLFSFICQWYDFIMLA